MLEQGPRLLGVLDLDLPLFTDLEVPLHLERSLEGEARPRTVRAQAEDLPRRAQLVAAIEDPVVFEGPRSPPLRLQLDQSIAQLVQLDTRKLDLALEIVLALHRPPRRSSSRATERIPL